MSFNLQKNAAIVFTLDGKANFPRHDPSKYMPLEVVGQQTFDSLTPFLPIHVDAFTQEEATLYINYLIERKFIQHPYSESLNSCIK